MVKLPHWLCVRGIDTGFTLVENIGGAAGKDFDLYVFCAWVSGLFPRFQWTRTYSATRLIASGFVDENTVLVLAASAEIVTLNLDVEIQLDLGGGAVLEQRKPLAIVLANAKVERSPVADGDAGGAPLAGLLGGVTLGVDVVLSGGGLALPLEVGLTVWAGQGNDFSIDGVKRDCLGFGACEGSQSGEVHDIRGEISAELTRVVGAANSDAVTKGVLYIDTTNARNAKLLRKARVCEVQLAAPALKTSNRLAGSALGRRPLRLLIAGRASVGAHSTIRALVTSDSSDDVGDKLTDDADILDTRPTLQPKVFERNGAVIGWESVAVNFTIGEVRVQTLGAAGRGRASGARRRNRYGKSGRSSDRAGEAEGGLEKASGAGRRGGLSGSRSGRRGDRGR